MVITVNRDTKPEELAKALKSLQKSKRKPLIHFYGALKGAFGDGLAYQKKLRS